MSSAPTDLSKLDGSRRIGRFKKALALLLLIPTGLLVTVEVPTLIAEQATEAKRREIAKAGGKCTLKRRPPSWLQAWINADFHTFLDRTVIIGVSMNGSMIDDTDVQALIGLPEVEILDFEDAQISELVFKTIEELWSLTSLNLANTPIREIAGLTKLPRLQQVNISYSKVRDAQLSPLTGLKGVRRINCAGLQLTDDGVAILAQCETLEELDISGATLGPHGLKPLKLLPELKLLILRNCTLDPDDLNRLAQALPNCKLAT